MLFTTLIDSAHRTVRNLKACCSIGAFSDANTLVRKLRDDLLQYTYVLSIINEFSRNINLDDLYIMPENKENIDHELIERLKSKLPKYELAVRAWCGNTVDKQKWSIRKKLDYLNYMEVLKNNHFVIQVLNQYDLENYWDKLSKRLNNYVHGNGTSYATHNRVMKHDENLEVHLKNIEYRTSYVVSFFMVLLLMIDSSLISSSDYTDYVKRVVWSE